LFVVDDVFEVEGRGIAVLCKLAGCNSSRFRIGDTVQIRRGDDPVGFSKISGMGFTSAGFLDVLLSGVTKAEIQNGDKIWGFDSEEDVT
jgi:hypothetical protein